MAAAAVAVPLFVAVLLLFRQPESPLRRTPAPKPAPVGLTRLGTGEEGTLLRDEATFGDPTPLFLPTEWNASAEAFSTVLRREPGGSFAGYNPKLKFPESALQLALPDAVTVPVDAKGALAAELPAQTYWSIGREGPGPEALPERAAHLEVRTAANGAAVLAQTISAGTSALGGAWQPLEFMVAIDRTGLVGPPILTESSRISTVDSYFAGYIVAGLHLGEKLDPGFYCISIGP